MRKFIGAGLATVRLAVGIAPSKNDLKQFPVQKGLKHYSVFPTTWPPK